MSDALWEQIEPLLPVPKLHPLGCHRPRIPHRVARDAILLVLRTGMQWNALDDTGICTCSSAYRRFREWTDAGEFATFWGLRLMEYDELPGNRHDMKLVAATLVKIMAVAPHDDTSKLCLALGYEYEEVRRIVRIAGFEPVIVGRQEERSNKKQCAAQARRWVGERTHSWINRFRRLLVRWETRENTYRAMLHFACGIIIWKAALTK
ncbi:MAG TPA: transposase [Armatimonadota bacterium]|nr:transposase [Armatimonadota bacterium]